MVKKTVRNVKNPGPQKVNDGKRTRFSFSHSACQIVLEKKAESLRLKRSRLADPCLSHNDNTTKNLFPMEPHRTKRGMLSRHYNQEVLLRSNPQIYQMLSFRGYLGKNFIPGFSYKNKNQPQQKQKQQGAQPWQKKTWKKKDEEDR